MNNFQIEIISLSSWAKAKGLTHCFIYHGPSMNPTFHNGDFLYLRSTARRFIKGDVIVFTDVPENRYIVHRIISATPEHLITRGDHNCLFDRSITKDQIVGKVELVETKTGINKVVDGFSGLVIARFWYSVFWLDRLMRQIFRLPYKMFRQSGLAGIIWKPEIARIQIKKGAGLQVKYIYKERTVATWDPARGIFTCRKPFDLVIPHPKKR